MTSSASRPSLDDVLDAYSVEPDPGHHTLEHYLRSYPEFAKELVDLSRELSRAIPENPAPLTDSEQAMIAAAIRRVLQEKEDGA